jgi:hypothetical protein
MVNINIENLHIKINNEIKEDILNILNNLENIDNEKSINELEIKIDVLKKMIIRWINLDDIIKEYNGKIKDLKNEKLQIEDKILIYMEKNNKKEIDITNGKLEKTKVESKEPFNDEYIKKCLSNTINDIEMIDKLTNILINNREIKECYKLKRKIDKNKNI